ncbi:unnamed protein product [Lupinus luteus]|uniref:Uncharacterized protein n=1 Tax=Lupinus luteus TaxID=3873 RepID=A0AAV1WZV5_LUPLU
MIVLTDRSLNGEYQITNGYGPDRAPQIMQDHWNTYITEDDFRFMQLKIDWLVILDDTTWNLDKLKMECYVVGKRHILRGASYETKIELIGSSSSKKEEILSIRVSLLSKFKRE